MNVQVARLRDRKVRLETGAVQFILATDEEDWPGLFVRGDNSLEVACSITTVLGKLGEQTDLDGMIAVGVLKELRRTILEEVIIKPKEKRDDRA